MKLEDLESEIELDSKLDKDLSAESLKIPLLAAKYRRYYVHESKVLHQAQIKQSDMEFRFYQYYNGEASEQDYRDHPINKLPLKGRIPDFIKNDKRMVELNEKVRNQELKVFAIQDFMKGLNQRSFDIKNAIAWERFKSGLN